MKITIIQPATVWENKPANFSNLDQLISVHYHKTELVVLPEMFATGFSLKAESLYEDSDGITFKWMKRIASEGGFAVCGSFILKSGEKYFNHFVMVTPQNEYYTSNKRHLFSLAGENKIFSRGNNLNIFTYNGIRFLPLICYDLRFPVWCRNRNDYDAILCVASWPDTRREAWTSLLKARAIENQCFVIGVNRTGIDYDGFNYSGDSVILDPLGKILASVDPYMQGSATSEILLPELLSFREKFPFWKDADEFNIKL